MTGDRTPTSEGGFTLLELLIATTLLSLILLLLFGSLRFGERAWEGAQSRGAGMDDLRAVQDLVRREIEQAYPHVDSSDPVHPKIEFDGATDRLTFLASAPQAAQAGGRERVTLLAERRGADMALSVAAEPELGASRNGAWSADLLHNVAAVRFSYLGADGWRARWSTTDAMPSLVRVQVEFRPGDGRVWPDLIVAPHIGADAGCILDHATKRCEGRS